MKKEKGFTLIELLAVIVILGIITVIAVPKVLDIINKSRESASNSSIKLVKDAIKTQVASSDLTGPVFTKETDGCYIFNFDDQTSGNTKSLEMSLKAEGEMQVHCARCGKPFVVPVKFRIHEILVREGSDSSDDETVVFSGEELDISEIVQNSFLMSVSGKYLCREDCKGLCPKCGADLNDGECGCDKEEIDPRWADLQKIMKNMTDTK